MKLRTVEGLVYVGEVAPNPTNPLGPPLLLPRPAGKGPFIPGSSGYEGGALVTVDADGWVMHGAPTAAAVLSHKLGAPLDAVATHPVALGALAGVVVVAAAELARRFGR